MARESGKIGSVFVGGGCAEGFGHYLGFAEEQPAEEIFSDGWGKGGRIGE
jgi:hypothetical protein